MTQAAAGQASPNRLMKQKSSKKKTGAILWSVQKYEVKMLTPIWGMSFQMAQGQMDFVTASTLPHCGLFLKQNSKKRATAPTKNYLTKV